MKLAGAAESEKENIYAREIIYANDSAPSSLDLIVGKLIKD